MFQSSFTIAHTPIGKPRQTQKDKFNPSDRVLKYREWADLAREAATGDPSKKIDEPVFGVLAVAHFEMPKSWPQKKKDSLAGTLHQSRPDGDNILKALQDAGFQEDSQIAWTQCIKLWCCGEEEPRLDVFLIRAPRFLAEKEKKK